MDTTRVRRTGALVVSMAMLAALLLATTAIPVSAAGKVTCQGRGATIVGTKKGERIVGTNGRDVIAGLGGNDLICGGRGADRLVGKQGLDRLYGNAGPDRLVGGDGPDRLFGGVGNDILAGQVGNDYLNGGPGTDRCTQGQGSGTEVSCEPFPLPLDGILAVAFSDIDGLDGYSSGDVLIARLMDTSGDGQPGAGDRVEMGRYPTNLDATAFGEWGVKHHLVLAAGRLSEVEINVITSVADFDWVRVNDGEWYSEADPAGFSLVQDAFTAADPDAVHAVAGSPSAPQTPVYLDVARPGDQALIDVVLNY